MVTAELKYIVKTTFFREFTDALVLRNATGIRKSVWGPSAGMGVDRSMFLPQFLISGSMAVSAQKKPTRYKVC